MTDTIVVPQHLATAIKQAAAPYGLDGGRCYNDKGSTHRRRVKWESCNPNMFEPEEIGRIETAIAGAVAQWYLAHDKPYISCTVRVTNAYKGEVGTEYEWTARGGVMVRIQETR